MIGEQSKSLITTSDNKKGLGLAASLALACYGAMKGAGAIVTALNIAYEETENRGFIVSNVVQASIVLGAGVLAPALIAAASIGEVLDRYFKGYNAAAAVGVQIVGSGVTAGLAVVALSALYRYGPTRRARTPAGGG